MQTYTHFLSYLAEFVWEWKLCRTKVVQKLEIHFLWSVNFFQKQSHLLVSAEKYSISGHRPQMTIWRMRIACRIPKAANTHSEYVMLIAFSLQQRLHERVIMLRYAYSAFVIWQCVWVAASGTHLMCFNTRFFIPSAIMSRPTMSKPASVARTSITCSGSSTGMWYFFIPANSSWHQNSS
jgi:hypothetical protein